MAAITPGGGSSAGVAATDIVEVGFGNNATMKHVTVEELLTGPGIVALLSGAAFTGIVTQPGTFAGIYVYDGSTAQTVATGSTPVLLTCFNTAAGANGLSNDCTPVKASNKITVTRAGTYLIAYSISYTSGVNTNWEFYAFNDGTQLLGTGAMSKIAVGADTQCVAGTGYAAAAAGKDIDLRGYHSDGGSANLTVSHCNLTVTRVGN
jgi:hypothetical protein